MDFGRGRQRMLARGAMRVTVVKGRGKEKAIVMPWTRAMEHS
jgi:hypothetical protein